MGKETGPRRSQPATTTVESEFKAPVLAAAGAVFGATVLVKRYPKWGYRYALLWCATAIFGYCVTEATGGFDD